MSQELQHDRGQLLLWTGVLGAPALWAIQFEINYALVPWTCAHHGGHFLLFLFPPLFLIGSLACGVIAWRQYSLMKDIKPDQPPPFGRTRFFAMLGMLTSSLFSWLIVAQAVAPYFLNPCWQ